MMITVEGASTMQSAEIESKLDAEQEYSAIESALLETARGRWFLAEHSRRSRRLETAQLEGALDLLKSSMRNPPALLGRLKTELDSISGMVQATRSELLAREKLAPRASGETGSSAPLSPVTGLLKAAEDLHELVWSLQSRDIDPVVCEQIGKQTAAIFALTSRQAEDSERVLKLAAALDAVGLRVAGALETVAHEAVPMAPPAETPKAVTI